MCGKRNILFLFVVFGAFFFSLISVAEEQNDSLFVWEDASDGTRELLYDYPKPAVIYAMNFSNGEKILPGQNFITLSIPGRSKAEIKIGSTMEILETGTIEGQPICPAETIEKGQVIFKARKVELYHESFFEGAQENIITLPSWENMVRQFWHSTGIYDIYRQSVENFSQTWNLGFGRLIMIFIGLVLLYLAIFKEFEPLLLLPIGFGAIMANIPLAGIAGPDGILGMVYAVGIKTGIFPLVIFLGVGAMTDFGPLIANPVTALLGAAAQFGIFFALLGSLLLSSIGINFNLCDAASIGIIGGADGPTAIFLTSKLSPRLLGAIAVAAYSYMALVPIIQPPIMKLLTSKADRKIKMKQLRHVSKLEKICFPIIITLLCAFLLPSAAPLISMLMLGNLMRECGVVERLSSTAQNALINTVTIFLGLTVGSKLSAENFLSLQTLGILLLGMMAFCIGTAAGVLFGQIMKIVSGGKINPLIGAAGVSAVPMSARVVNKIGLEADPHNFLLMHAMGPNVSGVIGSAVAAGVMLSFLA